MLPPEPRAPRVRPLVARQSYFVLHAPRQSGKTTTLLALAKHLNAEGQHTAVVLSVEVGHPFEEIGMAETAILDAWRGTTKRRLPADRQPPPWPQAPQGRRISAALQAWAETSASPLVLFLDEIDALRPDVLHSLLRQLRDGFVDRPHAFPASVALVGLRDVRDYVLASGGKGTRGNASPFNVKEESLTLADFSREDVEALYGQHTEATGQYFLPEAIDRAWNVSRGQPWLVNVLARECVESLVSDPKTNITAAHMSKAERSVIQRKDTHLDSLTERLQEPRVQRVVEPVLAGATLGPVTEDDLRYVLDLGLIRDDPQEGLVVANPIYREIIPSVLAANAQRSMARLTPSWLDADGHLNPDQLLSAFVDFWGQHAEALFGATPYHEIAPHLVLMAFLHRVANGGGTLHREYAIGTGRMDLLLEYGDVRVAMELKVHKPGRPDPLSQALLQLDKYLTGLGLEAGWVVIFDRRPERPIFDARRAVETTMTPEGRTVHVVRA